jgi:hypothetical protein
MPKVTKLHISGIGKDAPLLVRIPNISQKCLKKDKKISVFSCPTNK